MLLLLKLVAEIDDEDKRWLVDGIKYLLRNCETKLDFANFEDDQRHKQQQQQQRKSETQI